MNSSEAERDSSFFQEGKTDSPACSMLAGAFDASAPVLALSALASSFCKAWHASTIYCYMLQASLLLWADGQNGSAFYIDVTDLCKTTALSTGAQDIAEPRAAVMYQESSL